MRDRIAVQEKDKENHNQHHTMVTAKIQGRGQNKETKRVKERELDHVVIKVTCSRTNVALAV